ncbi:hypothetical protein H8F24_13640 [Synechococcus sp. CBW1002]|uniref:hypothetical protein n=1 Tax=Synechococcus sp. CBW1002 TaxID=1353134 RepID=UPI0018CCD1B2|nr:hypothetical protein [Synechococcus sp. CBW1002]QPN59118.1 hypothetical protein H8F24_13640 [Synechococcus sp. CBW1002]
MPASSAPARKEFPYTVSLILLAVFLIVQVASIESSFQNLLAASLLYIAYFFSSLYFKSLRIFAYPNSFLILLGFVIGFCAMPLVLRTLEGKSLVDGLYEPISTFGSIFLFTLISLASHYLYTRSRSLSDLRAVLIRLFRQNFNQTPRTVPLILIASVGLGALFISSASDGAFSKLLKAFSPLINLPLAAYLLLHIKSQANSGSKSPSRPLLIIVGILYAATLFIGMYFNTRFAFIQPLILVFSALCFVRLGLAVPFRANVIIALLIGSFLLNSFLTNLSYSIAMSRAYRSTIDPAELVSLTIENFTKEKADNIVYQGKSLWWNERYYNSEFSNRFSPIKNLDNLLHINQGLGASDVSEYSNNQLIRLISILPNPLPGLFGVTPEQKEEINQFSSADWLFGSISSSLEERRLTGNFIPDTIILYDFFAPFIYALLMLIIFTISDAFVIPLGRSNDLFAPSPLGMLFASQNIMFFASGTLVDLTVGHVRYLLQTSVAFFLSFFLLSSIANFFIKTQD